MTASGDYSLSSNYLLGNTSGPFPNISVSPSVMSGNTMSVPYTSSTLSYTLPVVDYQADIHIHVPGGSVIISTGGDITIPEGVEASALTKEVCTRILEARAEYLAEAVEEALLASLKDMAANLFPEDAYKRACWPTAMAATIRKKRERV